MKKSEIKFNILLDKDKIPEKITWNIFEDLNNDNKMNETKSISISIWDNSNKNTLRVDLWTKNMIVNDMKKFYIDILGGLSQSILNSTGDNYMSNEIKLLCKKLVKYIKLKGVN